MLSIIIPVKNQLYYTKQIYDEIKTKCPYEHEIIFINDNSADDTEAFLSLIEGDDVKVITQKENIGVNKSRNIGMTVAKNDLCLIINNDIVFTTQTIKNLVELADRENYKIICPVSTHKNNKREMPVFVKEDNICGRCYLVRKQDNLFPIPDELVLRYGDDRLFHSIDKKVQRVGDAMIHHFESKSIKSKDIQVWVSNTIGKDKIEWEKIKKDRGW